ncbi:FAD-dependent 5-carboxymethylaminomethyl-2-thiouridine(34) oxidoreductase MnmC [Psychrobacter sp. M13]|uniref:FAD-dependent 5-carboxymethylaminomethyl-2-thiouridine(34) oxidoreductase MnmC n=1 Tax=Psychrobacter sp. M13 TaxID=3067275 RepID=UPI00273B3855|nr:FAD-dependent 5-carboxymethylaminomethyl-2-thiouridine(34) oxidoreductase MnmC [Psychrobacter sp. M13]WLP93988.1 FAD-dependent 5-carboxymethylaminomethyl-2-thiouridine(34) oxidoreductase MnmC [Psychrobacter sp. M13]
MSKPNRRERQDQNNIADDHKRIMPAIIDWQIDDSGNSVPVSREFGDVYFSHADGLAESRYVFIDGNNLPERLAQLKAQQSFTISELGFGTGLNLLAVWQLWRQLRNTNPHLATARLHFITTEMHPIALTDLTQILGLWATRAPELRDLIEQLLANYPTLIAGAHRINFITDNVTVDIWLGDASESLAKLATDIAGQNSTNQSSAKIDAWVLDGFAPSCNESLWAQSIFAQMQRLSGLGSSAATYSCAGVVKRGLQSAGFTIKKIKGFGRKNEMLTAVVQDAMLIENLPLSNPLSAAIKNLEHSIVIGAGVSGLMTAWSLANRGIKVTLLDKTAPLAGASGNPRALLAPKMTPIHHVDEHLHTIGYLYSCRLYRQFNDCLLKDDAAYANIAPILKPTGALDLLIKANVNVEQIADYPDDLATTLSIAQAQDATNLTEQDLADNLYLPQSGLVNPQALKEIVLRHPLINFQQLAVSAIRETASKVWVEGLSNGNEQSITIEADNVVICAAFESHYIDERIFDCRKIRGQLSWFTPTVAQWQKLPKLPLKYSGYCAPFTAQAGDAQLNNVNEGQPQLLLGASFVRNDISTAIKDNEHQVSRNKLIAAIPELAAVISEDTSGWQARAGVRTQTPDYHPILGQVATNSRVWTLTAMGAKGYAYAPICAEVLTDMMLGNFAPISTAMLARLLPQRTRLQTPLA